MQGHFGHLLHPGLVVGTRSPRSVFRLTGVPSHQGIWPPRSFIDSARLDQMPRNAFRGTAEMFAYDALAQAVR